jgi:TonB family protein
LKPNNALAQELTYKWIQDRLRELNAGTLSEEDRKRLTSIASEDPFVADALEGFDVHADTSHDVYLEAIRKKITHQKRDRRRWLIPNLTVTAIAASALIIIATYAVMSKLEKDSEQDIFVFVSPDSLDHADTTSAIVAAEQPSPAVEKITEPSAPTSFEKENDVAATRATKPESTSGGTAPGTMAKADTRAIDGVPVTAPPVERKLESTTALDDAAKEDIVVSETAAQTAVLAGKESAKRDEGYFANQMNPALMQQRVTGQVVDQQSNDPIAGVKLATSFSNQLLYTDVHGQFELSVPENDVVVQASHPGYNDQFQVLQPGQDDVIVGMMQSPIFAPANAAMESKGPVYTAKNPAVEAHIMFSNYLKTASTLQLTTEPSAARRKVSLSFKVKPNGKPSDITILESSRDKTYDDEAIRLIKDGPEWYCPGGGFPCERVYTIYFR